MEMHFRLPGLKTGNLGHPDFLTSIMQGSRRDKTPRQETCQESSSVRPKLWDSGYRVNSITTTN